jgi:hypothetical protein
MASWGNPGYLAQQRRRLPAHKYRRLHLNLQGLPDGSAFQPEPVMDAIDRGFVGREPERDATYIAFVDMSGGSHDDAVLAIGHRDTNGRAIVDRVVDQGQRPPFDPMAAVDRFAALLREYRVSAVGGDRYAGETFRQAFIAHGVAYDLAPQTASQNYESLEPRLNARRVVLPDVTTLEQQLLGLVWRGGKIDHPGGEHDDYAAAVAGLVHALLSEELDELERKYPDVNDPRRNALAGRATWGHDDRDDWVVERIPQPNGGVLVREHAPRSRPSNPFSVLNND